MLTTFALRISRYVVRNPPHGDDLIDLLNEIKFSPFNVISGYLFREVTRRKTSAIKLEIRDREICKYYDYKDGIDPLMGGLPTGEPDIVFFNYAGKVPGGYNKSVFIGSIDMMENYLSRQYKPDVLFFLENDVFTRERIASLSLGRELMLSCPPEYEKQFNTIKRALSRVV